MNYMRLITHCDDPSVPEGKAALVIDNNGFVGTDDGWPLNGQPALFPLAQAEMLMTCWTYVQLYHPRLDEMPNSDRVSDKAVVFHSGTRQDAGRTLTSGGRVLGVTALGQGIAEALANVYAAVAKISFEGVHFRRDIGRRALQRS